MKSPARRFQYFQQCKYTCTHTHTQTNTQTEQLDSYQFYFEPCTFQMIQRALLCFVLNTRDSGTDGTAGSGQWTVANKNVNDCACDKVAEGNTKLGDIKTEAKVQTKLEKKN